MTVFCTARVPFNQALTRIETKKINKVSLDVDPCFNVDFQYRISQFHWLLAFVSMCCVKSLNKKHERSK